jgi:hypothetical protein
MVQFGTKEPVVGPVLGTFHARTWAAPLPTLKTKRSFRSAANDDRPTIGSAGTASIAA